MAERKRRACRVPPGDYECHQCGLRVQSSRLAEGLGADTDYRGGRPLGDVPGLAAKGTMPKRSPCDHRNFAAVVAVQRLCDVEDGPITGYSAEISIRCAECNEPFQFLGVPMGSHPQKPMASADLCELRAPIAPQGEYMPPPRMPGFNDIKVLP